MKRIMVIGACGSGKSTLARKIHDLTQLRLIHLDQEYWQPGWIEPDLEIWLKKNNELINQEAWVIDGNYGSSMVERIKRADTIVMLEVPTWKALYRVIKRVVKHWGKVRPDMREGCPEKLSLSFLHYVMMFNLTRRPGNHRKIREYGQGKSVHILKSNKDIEQFLETIKTGMKNQNQLTSSA